MAPIRPARLDELSTIPEALKQLKDIPKNLANLPSQLEEVYEKGTPEQQIETTIVVGESLVGMLKGKPPKVKSVVAAGVGSKKADKLGKVVNVADEAALLAKYPALADDAFKQLRKDPDFLKKFEEVVNDADLNKHVFEGEVKKGKVVGGHSADLFNGQNMRLGDGTHDLSKLPTNEYGVRKIDSSIGVQKKKEILRPGSLSHDPPQHRWYDKKIDYQGHTLFPENWSKTKIQTEVTSALKNPVQNSWGGKAYNFEATSASGMTIRWSVGTNGQITSFFPKF